MKIDTEKTLKNIKQNKILENKFKNTYKNVWKNIWRASKRKTE